MMIFPLLDLEKNIAGIKEDLKNFESAVNFASEIQSIAEVKCNNLYTLKLHWDVILLSKY